jgi:hypothetical protein
LVEAARDSDRDADLPAVTIFGEVKGIDHRVHDIAEQVSERGRTHHGKEQIGAWPDSIATQGVAERTQVMGNADLGGHVDHPADTQGRVVGEAHGRQTGAAGPELKHVIDHHPRLAEIDQDMVDGLPDRARRKLAIDERERADGVFVEGLLDGETLAVEPFEQIVRRPGRCGQTRTGDGGERQRGGDHPCSHG